MRISQLKEAFQKEENIRLFEKMYGSDRVSSNIERYRKTAIKFVENFGEKEFYFFSSPGRTEIGGNHTDHNHGKVLAASIHLDCVAAAAPNNSQSVHLISEPYESMLTINLEKLESGERNTGTVELLKGVLQGLKDQGVQIRGFDVYVSSNIISGAGVSSSAAFEMLIGIIVGKLFNEKDFPIEVYAKAGRYAENEYWNKASGLLDQMACGQGGIISIDFVDNDHPYVTGVDCDLDKAGYDLILVNTGKGHQNLSGAYSAIPDEMKKVAGYFGKEVLRQIREEDVLENFGPLRAYAGDRAVLRALHFFQENKRVEEQIEALKNNDFSRFLALIEESGDSSWECLQNCYVKDQVKEQPVAATLAATKIFLKNKEAGSCRVHGGGFAGVIAVYIKKEYTSEYLTFIKRVLEDKDAYVMYIRPYGAMEVCL